ncbi:MAG: CBS domain-containing protein [Nitrospirae bacterium]|nr:CBS domain-containing protein [Magnetococcales bacterium]
MHVLDSDESLAPILMARIRDIGLPRSVVLEGQTSISQAARTMRQHRSDVVLVHQEGRYGLLTSADIRDALAINQRPVDTAILEITSWEPLTAFPNQKLFHTFLRMTQRGVDHLVVCDSNKMLGILGLNELLSFFTHHASSIIQRIQHAATMDDLADAVGLQEHLIYSLFTKGLKGRTIGWLTQELDRLVFYQVAKLLAMPDLLDHVCILVMGSEGRGEQIVKTDQDNALIADDSLDDGQIRTFAEAFTRALLQLGYPLCPGNVMMRNPQWCLRLGQFQNKVSAWLEEPSPSNLMQMAIFFDARRVVGNVRLFQKARQLFFNQLPNDQAFYAHFAMAALAFETPLGIFKRFVVEKGPRQGQIDLKKGGIFPIVHGVRSMALEQKIREPNTVQRIRRLIRLEVLENSFGTDLIDAFDFLSSLRVKVAMHHRGDGPIEHEHLPLDSLGHMERENLRESLVLVDHFKNLLDHHFRLRMLR